MWGITGTLQGAGDVLGLTRERVRQILLRNGVRSNASPGRDGLGRPRQSAKVCSDELLVEVFQTVGTIAGTAEIVGLAPVTIRDRLHELGVREARRRGSHITQCWRGHEMTRENTYIPPDGGPRCRKCNALRTREYLARKKEAR